jgi:UDP-N-acetylmuramate dehydrogenase
MDISHFLDTHNILYECNVSLAQKSWIKQGGICGMWVMPQNKKQLQELCIYLYTNHIGFEVVGQTSNIFFHSTYNPTIVVSTIHVNEYVIYDDCITCDCGVNVVKLSKDCMSHGFAGFYGLVGLPGTVGSAIYNNASCFNCSLSSMLISAEVLTTDGVVKYLSKEDFGYSHRSSLFKLGKIKGVLLSVKLKIEKADDIEEEYRKSDATVKYRQEKQERKGRNLGSIYAEREKRKNIPNFFISIILSILIRLRLIHNHTKTEKNLLLCIYGYFDLFPYVSDRNINTFIWKDNRSEEKFSRYKRFMNRAYKGLVVEIEEKY